MIFIIVYYNILNIVIYSILSKITKGNRLKVVTIANRKGGTGKTTTTFNLAFSKAIENKKVLLIDLDSQGNLTKACSKNFIDLEDFMNAQTQSVAKNLDILPACKNYKQIEKVMNDAMVPTSFLSKNLMPKISGYDYVLVDTSPAVNIINTNGFLISDMILIVMQLDYFSMLGLSDMFDIVAQVKEHNPDLEYKIVVNQYQKNRNLNRAIEDKILALDNFTGVFIPHRQNIKENIAKHLPSIDSVKEYEILSECL